MQFQYYDYSPDKQRILRRDGEIYVNSPYALLWNDDRYYMLGYSEKHQKVISFRIDRMLKVKVTGDDRGLSPKDFSAASYARKVIKMYDGVEREVILRCDNVMMMSVIDRFGIDIETERIDDDHFKARIMVQTSPTFYGWIFQFEGKIRIMEPEDVKQEYFRMLQLQLEKTLRAERLKVSASLRAYYIIRFDIIGIKLYQKCGRMDYEEKNNKRLP